MKIPHEVPVHAPAADAWQVLGVGFGHICEWAGSLSHSELEGDLGVGATRSCTGAGFGPIPPSLVVEELVHYDPDAMEFSYVARGGLPWFMVDAHNAWSVHARGDDRCVVRFSATFHMVWWLRFLEPLLVRMMAKDLAKMDEEMVYRIEHGVPHPRVLAAQAAARAA